MQCAACVSYCGTSFQIGENGEKIVITSGERLDSIIQKFAMILSNGLGACTSSDLQHDPYNVYAGTITSDSAEVLWDGVWSSSTGINVYLDTQVAPGGWVLQNTTPIATTISNYKITNLTASTAYKVKVQDAGNSAVCKPIEILFSTSAS
ncbi:MAG: fibronectin type III domain-containing protein [Alphaproteobacteria bacterium]|nr:fibronectin type III domain-containing protein [Alphaproteobacteria bacterium]